MEGWIISRKEEDHERRCGDHGGVERPWRKFWRPCREVVRPWREVRRSWKEEWKPTKGSRPWPEMVRPWKEV